MTISNRFNLDPFFYFIVGLVCGFVFGMNNHVFAASSSGLNKYGDNKNDFSSPAYTMTEFVSLNELISETGYKDGVDYYNEKINSCYMPVLVSYYNFASYDRLDSSKIFKSFDFFCIPEGVKFEPVINDDQKVIGFNFSSKDKTEKIVEWRDYYNILPKNWIIELNEDRDYKFYLSFYGDEPQKWETSRVVRSVFNLHGYGNFDQPMPNFFMDHSFKTTNFIENIFNSTNSFGWYIALMVSLFVVLYLLDKKLGLGFNFDYKGGAKL